MTRESRPASVGVGEAELTAEGSDHQIAADGQLQARAPGADALLGQGLEGGPRGGFGDDASVVHDADANAVFADFDVCLHEDLRPGGLTPSTGWRGRN